MKKYFLFFLICFSIKIFSQDIPQNISYTTIYDFMDELAGEGLIDLNSGIRPYSRKYIAEKLVEAKRADSLLSRRAKKDLEFVENKLNNPGFMAKAPEKVVAQQRDAQEKHKAKIAMLEESLLKLK